MQTNKKEISRLIDLGVDAKRKGDYNLAMEFYNEAKRYDEFDSQLQKAIGKIFFIQKNFNQAALNFLFSGARSSYYVNLNYLMNSEKLLKSNLDISEKFKIYNAVGSSQALLVNIGRHCGYSILAEQYYDENKRTPIQAALNLYMSRIDPYSTPKFTKISSIDLEEIEREAEIMGYRYLYERVSQMDNPAPLKQIIEKLVIKS